MPSEEELRQKREQQIKRNETRAEKKKKTQAEIARKKEHVRTLDQKLASGRKRVKELARKIKKKGRRGLPNWLPDIYADEWRQPWNVPTDPDSNFKQLIWKHGYLSPHITIDETRCKDAARTRIPDSLRGNAQRQAFMCERLRHDQGDEAIFFLSWYRTVAHNNAVGGASQSRHISADATDWDARTYNKSGWTTNAERIWANDGLGAYPSGGKHTDARGYRARWSSF